MGQREICREHRYSLENILGFSSPVLTLKRHLKQLWPDKTVITRGSDLPGMKLWVSQPGQQSRLTPSVSHGERNLGL